MTKQEAYEAMLLGEKVRHYNYSGDEHIYMKPNTSTIRDENGYNMGGKFGEFWTVYQNWEDGWEIYKPKESNPFNQDVNEVYEFTNPYHGLDEVIQKPLKRGCRVKVRTEPKINRNSLCPCGSGKKYKKCCL